MASTSNRVFFDANLLLELVDERSGVPQVRRLVNLYRGKLFISSLTGHLVMHFGRKTASVGELRILLTDYTMLSLTAADFEWAYTNMRDDDFEDALQIAVAIRNGCDTFITFDKKLHNTYKSLPQLKIQLVK